jgi:hypothetical protein
MNVLMDRKMEDARWKDSKKEDKERGRYETG